MAPTPPPSVNLNDNRGPGINRVVAVAAVLGSIAVVGRIASRGVKRVPLAASDYMIVLGLIIAWAMAILVFIGE